MIKLGDLGRIPVPHADTVSINVLHKTEENREEAAVKIGEEGYCEQETVRLSSGLAQERVLAGSKDMVVGVVCCSHVRCTQFASEKGRAFEVGLGALAGIVADRPVPFMEKAFIVTPLTEGLAREVKYLGSKLEGHILPARGVMSDGSVLVTSEFSFRPLYVGDAGFKRDKEEGLRGEIGPDPSVEKEVRGDALGDREHLYRILLEQRAINRGT